MLGPDTDRAIGYAPNFMQSMLPFRSFCMIAHNSKNFRCWPMNIYMSFDNHKGASPSGTSVIYSQNFIRERQRVISSVSSEQKDLRESGDVEIQD